MAYETFSPEEVDGIVYRASPKVAPTTPAQSILMQTAALPSGPIKPSKSQAAEPNVSSLVKNVSEANKGIQESTPAPQAPSAIDALVNDITNNWKTVLTVAAVPALGYLANKVLGGKPPEESKNKSIKDRLLVPSERVEPTFSPPSKVGPITDLPGTPEELQKALGPNWEATLAKSEAARKEKQMLAQERARASMGELPTPTASPAVPVSQPIAPAPVAQVAAQTAPVVPPTVAQLAQEAAPAVNAAAQAPAEAIPPAEKNKGGRKGQGKDQKLTYKTPAELPEGMVFKEGFGGADNWMKNSFNDESRIMIRDLFNEGKPYGANMEKAYGDARKYETWLKENIPVQTYARTERKAAGLPPPENYGKLGTAIKVGGIGGLLMTAGQAANAKQVAQDVGEALLPIGMTPSTAGAPVLPPNILAAQKRQMEEMQKLGSPYRKR